MKKNQQMGIDTRDRLTQSDSKAILSYETLRTKKANRDGVCVENIQEPVQTPISVILPAYNEESSVGSGVEDIRRALRSQGIKYEILVIDDGSKDKTVEKAIHAGARVLRCPENRGYGAAIKRGIVAAKYDTIVIMDPDGTYPADQIPSIVAKLDTSDMVVGARIGKQVDIPWIRRPAKWLLGWLANRVSGQSIPDLNSGLRAFRRECMKQYFSILSNRFSFTTTSTLALLADDYHVVYHPINYYRRIGKSKVTPRHFIDFIILVLRMAMLFQPLKVFVPLAFSCSLVGALKAVYDIVTVVSQTPTLNWSLLHQPVLSTSSILLFLSGLQFLLIGMVADAVLRRIGQHNRPLAPSFGDRVFEVQSYPQDHEQDTHDSRLHLNG